MAIFHLSVVEVHSLAPLERDPITHMCCLSVWGTFPLPDPQHILGVGSIALNLHLGHWQDNIISRRGLHFRYIPPP